MKTSGESSGTLTRRQMLQGSGVALGGLAMSGRLLAAGTTDPAATATPGLAPDNCKGNCYPTSLDRQSYTYFEKTLEPLYYYKDEGGFRSAIYPPLKEHEMRITFMGSGIPPVRRVQQMMSVFVEVGWDAANHRAQDQFVFDCGSGVCANYGAMEVGFGRMDKVFLTHLHGDHMSDLTHIYCFGCSSDRLSPLYVFGPSASGIKNPRPPHNLYDDGTKAFCSHLREALRWHSESFSFQPTSYKAGYPTAAEIQRAWGLPVLPTPVSDDPFGDGYAMVPIELDWTKVGGVAYDNRQTGVRITHFPVIHCRDGSIGYKLEWRGLTMIFTGDTKPEKISIEQAINGGRGVDVFIHEMVVPAEIWAMQARHIPQPPPLGASPLWDATVERATQIQDSSHTPPGAFGYLLSQIKPRRPRLTVATHFPVADDTVACAFESVRKHVPDIGALGEQMTFSCDRMVISAFAGGDKILQRRGEVLEFGFTPVPLVALGADAPPKYRDAQGVGDPYAQIDRTQEIQAGADTYCRSGY